MTAADPRSVGHSYPRCVVRLASQPSAVIIAQVSSPSDDQCARAGQNQRRPSTEGLEVVEDPHVRLPVHAVAASHGQWCESTGEYVFPVLRERETDPPLPFADRV
jgi:hypothetical protein